MLTAAQTTAFERDGFLVLPSLISEQDCQAVRDRTAEMLADVTPESVTATFSTSAEGAHVRDEYFLESAAAMRFFWEADAVDPHGRLTRPKEVAVNKFGHAMHDLDPVHDHFCRRTGLGGVAADLGYGDPLLVQSMYIYKPPYIGGEVVLHNDHTFIWTEPMRTLGFWIALEPSTLDNGCLWAEPGGHHQPQRRRFRQTPEGSTTIDVWAEPPEPGELVPIEAATGTVVVLDGLLPHRSNTNRSATSRHAYTLHVVDRAADWPADNWLQRPPELPYRGF